MSIKTMLLLSVFDSASKIYTELFTKTTQEEAIREFILAVRNPQTMLNQFPEQFELHQLATVDSDGTTEITGQLTSDQNNHMITPEPTVIITAIQVKQADEIHQANQQIKQEK